MALVPMRRSVTRFGPVGLSFSSATSRTRCLPGATPVPPAASFSLSLSLQSSSRKSTSLSFELRDIVPFENRAVVRLPSPAIAPSFGSDDDDGNVLLQPSLSSSPVRNFVVGLSSPDGGFGGTKVAVAGMIGWAEGD